MSHRLNINYTSPAPPPAPTQDTMIFTTTGILLCPQNYYFPASASGTIDNQPGPPYHGDGISVVIPVFGEVSDAAVYLNIPAPAGGLIFTLFAGGNPTPTILTVVPGDTSAYITGIAYTVNATDDIIWQLTGDPTGYAGKISISVQF